MKRITEKRLILMVSVITMLLLPGVLVAAIPGITGPDFSLTAKTGTVVVDDGSNIFMWGFANGTGSMQYPAPTLIVTEGQLVTVSLTNQLPVNVSIVFPGQTGVTATGGVPGLLTNDAAPGGTVTYTFTAGQPGTYTYYSGTQPELQVEMGLVGALIIRPLQGPKYAYNDAATVFDREYLFVLSEMDPPIHVKVQQGKFDEIDNSEAYPVAWFMNGRAGMDTVAANNDPIFPHQPYAALALMQPGERVLVRMVGAGRDLHPFHLHGNHHRVIAKDGRLLKSGLTTDLSEGAFTTSVGPGQTFDAIWSWTGANMGWDFYGHKGPNGEIGQACVDAGVALQPGESLADHCKPIPVAPPDNKDMFFGPLYTGSPYLGGAGPLPPGEGGFNPYGAYPFMWHSHAEKELTSYNVFPGGMLTWALVVPPGLLQPEP